MGAVTRPQQRHVWNALDAWLARRGLAERRYVVAGSGPARAALETALAAAPAWLQAASSPRQADLLLVCAPVNSRLATALRQVYEQMPVPRCVVQIGTCLPAEAVGQAEYAVLPDQGALLPIALTVTGCPPQPGAILSALQTVRVEAPA